MLPHQNGLSPEAKLHSNHFVFVIFIYVVPFAFATAIDPSLVRSQLKLGLE